MCTPDCIAEGFNLVNIFGSMLPISVDEFTFCSGKEINALSNFISAETIVAQDMSLTHMNMLWYAYSYFTEKISRKRIFA